MPPKKADAKKAAEEAPPPPPPPDPAMIAAQELVAKWEKRIQDINSRLDRTQRMLNQLDGETTRRETAIRQLATDVQDATDPFPKPKAVVEDPKASKGKAAAARRQSKANKDAEEAAAAAAAAAAEAEAAMDEDAKKKAYKTQNAMINAFKKKKQPPVLNEEGEVVSKLPKPNLEINEELWNKVLSLRDERLDHEDALATVRTDIESVHTRREGLDETLHLAKYALISAQHDLEQATKRWEIANGLAAPENDGSPLQKTSSLARLSSTKLSPTPPASPGNRSSRGSVRQR